MRCGAAAPPSRGMDDGARGRRCVPLAGSAVAGAVVAAVPDVAGAVVGTVARAAHPDAVAATVVAAVVADGVVGAVTGADGLDALAAVVVAAVVADGVIGTVAGERRRGDAAGRQRGDGGQCGERAGEGRDMTLLGLRTSSLSTRPGPDVHGSLVLGPRFSPPRS